MRFEKLDLNLLVALDVILDERHVGRAAKRLCLSQPAMSSALKRLRDFLDDSLLVRSGADLVLTPRAASLRQPIREILERIRSELILPPLFDHTRSDRTFILAASDYTIRILLLPAFRRFARLAPHLSFRVLPLGDDVREEFARGNTDLLIAPSQIISTDHPASPLFEDDYVVGAWAQNSLIANGLDEESYFRLGHVSATFGKMGLAAFDEWLERRDGRKRRIELSLPSFRDVPDMLIGTDRIATMHRRYAEDLSKRLPLKLFPIPFEHPPLIQYAQWHNLRGSDPGICWLVGALREFIDRN